MNFLNRLGLPAKYGFYGLIGSLFSVACFFLLGFDMESPVLVIVGCTIGGYIGGILRKKKGKTS